MSKNIDELKKEILNKQKQAAKEKLPETRNDGSDDKKIVNLPGSNIAGLATTGKGKICNTAANVATILQTDRDLKDMFSFDVRLQRPIVNKDKTIKINNININFKAGWLTDDTLSALSVLMSARYTQFTQQNIVDGVNVVAANRPVNRLADFMDDCYKNWDGKKRVDTFLPDFLGVEKSNYSTWVTKKFFTGVVEKCYHPERNSAQFCLDLLGGIDSQGVGKTLLCKRMALCQFFNDEYYTDSFTSFVDKDSLELISKALIANDDEFVVSSKPQTQLNSIKRLITSSFFEYRAPFARASQRHPKGSMLMRTRNQLEVLVDRSGNRRFLELEVDRSKKTKSVYQDLTPELVKQLYGEFAHYYKDEVLTGKYSLALSSDELKELTDLQLQKFTLVGDAEMALDKALVQLLKAGNTFLTLPQIDATISKISNQTIQLDGKLSHHIRYLMTHKHSFEPARKVQADGTRPRGFLFTGSDKNNVD